MSFDIDPEDSHQRFLLHHSESDCWFEVFTPREAGEYLSRDGCDDVTDLPKHEESFIKYKKEKGI